ncbi:hypothetical protein THAOC_36917 [Thalassiosira oceanica]|uniref:Uncharacterized protein n=1 Tax=Thalassiosira oceanica TaxID=159749 RepID=K0QZE8_THAOC|nr:hypothetical protein THAOC_36917 [Thalassiosira oceanica]|eukprot:EJK44535.1 hypothetical protein THAOC_36917 [Thalassiosira oceanica]
MAMAFQLGRNTGATGGLSHPWFDGSDYLRPKPKDAGRDRERKWVFQKRNAKDHSEVEEGEDFSEVAGFDKASHRRNHGKNGNLLGLDDIAKVSTVEMNNQSRDCSDEVLKKIKDRGDWNDDNNPNKSERNLSGTPSTRFAIDVLTNEDGAFDTNGGKWKRVWEGYRIADTCGMIGIWLNYLYNMAQGDEKLLPQKESGSGKEIMDKFIKVTALETDVRQEDRDDDNLHKPTTEDKRILSEAKEAMRSLVCPENKLVITDLGGCFLGKYPGFEQFGKGSSVRVTRGQLDPYETFETGGHITEEKCAWSSDGRRCVYTRNSKPEPGYVELWSEDIHGKWSDIEVGVRNPAHGSIPEETIKRWRDMTKRKRGGQSKGGVYKLDIERREVIEYKDYWSAFGYANGRKGIKVGDVVNAGRGGKELDGNLYVHESQCKEKTYVEGDILPLKAPVVQP